MVDELSVNTWPVMITFIAFLNKSKIKYKSKDLEQNYNNQTSKIAHKHMKVL